MDTVWGNVDSVYVDNSPQELAVFLVIFLSWHLILTLSESPRAHCVHEKKFEINT